MKLTKYGHSCLLVEEGDARLLIDPGAYSNGFEGLRDLDAILITHFHADHFVLENIKNLLTANPEATVLADETSAGLLDEAGLTAVTMQDGDKQTVRGVEVAAVGSLHAVIHPSIPQDKNVGYRIGSDFFYPGDALTEPTFEVRVLAIPASAPWSKVSETIDYLTAVKPKIAIPVHDGFLSRPSLFGQMLERFATPQGTAFKVLEQAQTVEL